MERVRSLSLALRPTMLDDLGLLPALLWQFERYTAQTSIRVICEHRGLDQRFPPDVETTAYRIAQEALTNVARHAGVVEVTVQLWADQEILAVQIIDHGRGFDPAITLAGGMSSGLSGMQERAIAAYIDKAQTSTLDPFDTLTTREREVLQLAAEGCSTSEIALRLSISPRTAEAHRAHSMRKLGLQSQTDLVRYAIRRGIIPLES